MRILIVVDDYLPSSKSGAQMIHDLGLEMVRLGNEVIVLTPSATAKNSLEVSQEDRMQILRVRAAKLKGISRVRRAFNEIRLSSLLWKGAGAFLGDTPCDLVVFYSPTIFWGTLVKKLKSSWKCPAYLILRDIFPKWAVEAGIMRRGLIYRYFRFKELAQYRQADMIGVESQGNLMYFRTELQNFHFPVEVLPNWAASEINIPATTRYRRELGLDGKVVFFYGGNIGAAQDVDNIVRLASSLREQQSIFFLLVGEGSEVTRLEKCVHDLGLSNIKLLSTVSQEIYVAMLQEFDVGLLTLHRDLTSHNVPGKLLGYMKCSKPVLASVNRGNDIRHILEEAKAGICCENGEDEKLRKAAMLLAGDPELRQTMGKNSRRLLESRFSDNAAANQILSYFIERHGQELLRNPDASAITAY